MSTTIEREISSVKGYFLQDDPATDPETFDYVHSSFGLINQPYSTESTASQEVTQWKRFKQHIDLLNSQSDTKRFKVLFLGRHGQGVHNVAESHYGTECWDAYWSLQNGDAENTWVDARLTQEGIDQARVAHEAWKKQIQDGIPSPQSYYVSPLNRCLATARVTFERLPIPRVDPFQPMIKELLRETMGQHTCDRRSTATEIAEEYPSYHFEDGFTDEDLLWDPKVRESNEDRNKRLRSLLDDIFATDESTYISLTAHSGAITSVLEVLGHRKFALATGAMIPVVVMVERQPGFLKRKM